MKEEEAQKKLTPEEIAAEKLRQKQIQEESDLALARDAFGKDSPPHSIICYVGIFTPVRKGSCTTIMAISIN